MEIRDAYESDIEPLAQLWYDGWQDAHAAVVPSELKRLRTRESFTERMAKMISTVRAAGPVGAPLGFHIVKDDELYQLYVSADARGTGVAAALIDDAERTLADHGTETAWLACAIGNDRAARFYEKRGWRRVATVKYHAETSAGPFPIENWRYEKELG